MTGPRKKSEDGHLAWAGRRRARTRRGFFWWATSDAWYIAGKAAPAEPAIDQIAVGLVTQPPLGTDG